MSDITRVLDEVRAGTAGAAELLPLVYDELRKLAAAKLAHEKPGQTLEATALVHEAYLRLVGEPGVRPSRPLLRRRGRGDAADPRRERPPQEGREARRRTSAPRCRRCAASPPRNRPRTWSPSTKRSTNSPRSIPSKAELVKLRYFAGPDHRGGRGGTGHLPPRSATGINGYWPLSARRGCYAGRCSASRKRLAKLFVSQFAPRISH